MSPKELKIKLDDWQLLSDLLGVMENISVSACGGVGVCGKCRVTVLEGERTPPSEKEKLWLSDAELEGGIRLACYCRMRGAVRLRFSEKMVPQILLNNVKGNRDIYEKNGIWGGDSSQKQYGMAVDLGTTSVVGSLVSLGTGEEMSSGARLNPQCNFGLDIISRVNYASLPGGTERLQRCILDCLDEITLDNCQCSGIKATEIQEIVITGNTVMLHILTGVNPSAMGCFPYKPEFTSAISVPANRLGLRGAVNATVFCMPSNSAFIGADVVAGVLATGMDQKNDNILLLDLGTNGEMVMSDNHSLWACSVAVGPALEGMNIECGMRAEVGAVDKVWIEKENLCLHVIGERPAGGLCGSGLIDTVGALWKIGIVSADGRLHKHAPFWLRPPVGREKGVYISQNDIRQLQLAKGAICAGIKLLLGAAGMKARQVDKVNLAGALGNYINSDVLIELGFLPQEWRGKIRPVGNTALQGAIMGLLSTDARNRAEQAARRIKCLDLASDPEFQNLFFRCMSFGSTSWTSAIKF